jgi:WD40 repeat protein
MNRRFVFFTILIALAIIGCGKKDTPTATVQGTKEIPSDGTDTSVTPAESESTTAAIASTLTPTSEPTIESPAPIDKAVLEECRAAMPGYLEALADILGYKLDFFFVGLTMPFDDPSISNEDMAQTMYDFSNEEVRDARAEAGDVEPPACLVEHHNHLLDGLDIIITLFDNLENDVLPAPDARPFEDSYKEIAILLLALTEYVVDPEGFLENINDYHADGIATLSAIQIYIELSSEREVQVEFMPDGRRFVTLTREILSVWDSESGDRAFAIENLPDSESPMNAFAISPDGNYIVSGGCSGVCIWDAADGALVRNIAKNLSYIEAPVFSSDSTRVAVTSFPGTSGYVYGVPEGAPLLDLRYEQGLDAIDFSLDGRYIVTTGLSSDAVIWDARTGRQLRILGRELEPYDALFTPDSKSIVTTACIGMVNHECVEGHIAVWDAESGEQLFEKYGHDNRIRDLDFSSDGRILVTGGGSTAILWDLENGSELMNLEHEQFHTTDDVIWETGFSPYNDYLLTRSFDGLVTIWDIQIGDMLLEVGDAASADWNHLGTSILVGSNNGSASIIDVETGETLLNLRNTSRVGHNSQTNMPESTDAITSAPVPVVDHEYMQILSINADLHYQSGNYEEAVAIYDELIELNPTWGMNYFLRSLALEGLGDYDAAIEDLLTSIELGQFNTAAYNNLCWYYGLTEKPELSLPYCQQATRGQPDWASFDSRGLVYAQLGDFEAAIADFQFVVDDLEDDPDPEMQSNRSQRLEWLETLLDGENPFTPEVLAKLRGEVDA